MERRTIIFGDIHGCLEEFKSLLDKIGYSSQDRLICAGDLVDRGPNSAEVVRFVMTLGAECVAGNHDDKLIRRYRHLKRAEQDPTYKVPMRYSADQENTIKNLTDKEINWLQNLPAFIKLEEYNTIVVHAGAPLNGNFNSSFKGFREYLTMVRYLDQKTNKMLSLTPELKQPLNSVYWAERYCGSYDIVYGHCVHSLTTPRIDITASGAKCYGIDTGAVFGGHLTCAILENGAIRFEQIKAYREYSVLKINK